MQTNDAQDNQEIDITLDGYAKLLKLSVARFFSTTQHYVCRVYIVSGNNRLEPVTFSRE